MILIIDDEPNRMDCYIKELEAEKFEVKICKHIDQALDFLENHFNSIELLILDVMMPPGNTFKSEDTDQGLRTGALFYRLIKEKNNWNFPIFVFTNIYDDELSTEVNNDPESWLFHKEEFMSRDFAEKVRSHLSS